MHNPRNPLMTPRALPLPFSFDIEAFPSPWHGAPRENVLAAKAYAESAGAFSDCPGRRGILLWKDESGSVGLFAAEEPFRPSSPSEALAPADGIAGKTSDEVFWEQAKTIGLVTMAGTRTTLADFARSERAKRPARIARGGAAGLNLTFEHWNRALIEALDTPLTANLLHAAKSNAEGKRLTLLASLEWWHGDSPSYDVKWDGMILSPRTTIKPLAEFLLEGVPFESDPRRTSNFTRTLKPEVICEEADFVAVFKPSGLLSVPGTGGLPDAMTLAGALVGRPLTAVHRLDMDTSGILLFAKTLKGTQALMAAFREGRVRKRYRAVLDGVLAEPSGEIHLPVTTHPLDRLRQIVALGGRPSTTKWRKVASCGNRTLVDFFPLTGRTHQLRIHAAHRLGLCAPIVGDPYYGRRGLLDDSPETPLLLHAAEITFPDPASGECVTLSQEEPFAL